MHGTTWTHIATTTTAAAAARSNDAIRENLIASWLLHATCDQLNVRGCWIGVGTNLATRKRKIFEAEKGVRRCMQIAANAITMIVVARPDAVAVRLAASNAK